MVPARAGMSPFGFALSSCRMSGPRASGDEPTATNAVRLGALWSPRERG